MQVNYIETKNEEGGAKLIMVVDDETEIVVDNYGEQRYTLTIRNINTHNSEYNPGATLSYLGDGKCPQTYEFWGHAVVWAEPLTIAHLVMDTITNQ